MTDEQDTRTAEQRAADEQAKADREQARDAEQQALNQRAQAISDGYAVDPAAESAGVPDILDAKLREVGATDQELSRLRDEYHASGYQERMLANQQARGFDNASVAAYLETARARWRDEQASGDQLAREQNVAVDSGVQVRTVPAPDATAEPRQATTPAPASGVATSTGVTIPAVTTSTSGETPPSELELRQMVPTGPGATREKVMDWVDEAPDPNQRVLRAQAALHVETHTAGEEPRTTLVDRLRKVVEEG